MKEEGIFQGWIGSISKSGFWLGNGWCRWYRRLLLKDVQGRSERAMWRGKIQCVKGMMKDLQEFFWSGVVFFDLFSNNDGLRVMRWYIVSLGSLTLLEKDDFWGR